MEEKQEMKEPKDIEQKEKEIPSIDDSMELIMHLPEDLKMAEQKILSLSGEIETVDYDIKGIELKIYSEVYNEKTEESKNKFPNEKLREKEVYDRMKVNTFFIELQQNRRKLIDKISIAKIDQAYLDRRFKAVRYLIDALSVKYKVF